MHGFLRSLDRPCETIGKEFTRTSGTASSHGLKDHVVAGLRIRRAIPGTVERDEHSVAVVGWKLLLIVERCAVRAPMRGEGGNRANFISADSYLLAAVPAVFRRQHQLPLKRVVVALRPSVVAAL